MTIDAEKVVAFVMAGNSKADAARAFGVTRSRIGQICSKAGVIGMTDAGRQARRQAIVKARRLEKCKAEFQAYCLAKRIADGRPEPITLLKQYERGGCTYGDLAQQYGVTRNQVAGAINRARGARGAEAQS